MFELKLDPEYHFSNQPFQSDFLVWHFRVKVVSLCQPMWKIMVYEIQKQVTYRVSQQVLNELIKYIRTKRVTFFQKYVFLRLKIAF